MTPRMQSMAEQLGFPGGEENLYQWAAERSQLGRTVIKTIIIGLAYGLSERRLVADGVPEDALEIAYETFPNLRLMVE